HHDLELDLDRLREALLGLGVPVVPPGVPLQEAEAEGAHAVVKLGEASALERVRVDEVVLAPVEDGDARVFPRIDGLVPDLVDAVEARLLDGVLRAVGHHARNEIDAIARVPAAGPLGPDEILAL